MKADRKRTGVKPTTVPENEGKDIPLTPDWLERCIIPFWAQLSTQRKHELLTFTHEDFVNEAQRNADSVTACRKSTVRVPCCGCPLVERIMLQGAPHTTCSHGCEACSNLRKHEDYLLELLVPNELVESIPSAANNGSCLMDIKQEIKELAVFDAQLDLGGSTLLANTPKTRMARMIAEGLSKGLLYVLDELPAGGTLICNCLNKYLAWRLFPRGPKSTEANQADMVGVLLTQPEYKLHGMLRWFVQAVGCCLGMSRADILSSGHHKIGFLPPHEWLTAPAAEAHPACAMVLASGEGPRTVTRLREEWPEELMCLAEGSTHMGTRTSSGAAMPATLFWMYGSASGLSAARALGGVLGSSTTCALRLWGFTILDAPNILDEHLQALKELQAIWTDSSLSDLIKALSPSSAWSPAGESVRNCALKAHLARAIQFAERLRDLLGKNIALKTVADSWWSRQPWAAVDVAWSETFDQMAGIMGTWTFPFESPSEDQAVNVHMQYFQACERAANLYDLLLAHARLGARHMLRVVQHLVTDKAVTVLTTELMRPPLMPRVAADVSSWWEKQQELLMAQLLEEEGRQQSSKGHSSKKQQQQSHSTKGATAGKQQQQQSHSSKGQAAGKQQQQMATQGSKGQVDGSQSSSGKQENESQAIAQTSSKKTAAQQAGKAKKGKVGGSHPQQSCPQHDPDLPGPCMQRLVSGPLESKPDDQVITADSSCQLDKREQGMQASSPATSAAAGTAATGQGQQQQQADQDHGFQIAARRKTKKAQAQLLPAADATAHAAEEPTVITLISDVQYPSGGTTPCAAAASQPAATPGCTTAAIQPAATPAPSPPATIVPPPHAAPNASQPANHAAHTSLAAVKSNSLLSMLAGVHDKARLVPSTAGHDRIAAASDQASAVHTVPPPQVQAPSGFICPVTLDVMKDPVMAMDGHTYERSAIEAWLAKNQTSPLTGALLPATVLMPNHALRISIQEWRELHGC